MIFFLKKNAFYTDDLGVLFKFFRKFMGFWSKFSKKSGVFDKIFRKCMVFGQNFRNFAILRDAKISTVKYWTKTQYQYTVSVVEEYQYTVLSIKKTGKNWTGFNTDGRKIPVSVPSALVNTVSATELVWTLILITFYTIIPNLKDK